MCIFLPFEHLEEFLDDLRLYCSENISSVIIHGVYVNNTLLLFFKDFAANYQDLERFICQRHYPGQAVTLKPNPPCTPIWSSFWWWFSKKSGVLV